MRTAYLPRFAVLRTPSGARFRVHLHGVRQKDSTASAVIKSFRFSLGVKSFRDDYSDIMMRT